MRIALLLAVLVVLALPVAAHDDIYGLTRCYAGHCPQDTLVFGTVTHVDATRFAVRVQSVIREAQRGQTGHDVTLKSTGGEYLCSTRRAPKVGDALLVSFRHTDDGSPEQPNYLVRSTRSRWQFMTVDAARPSSAAAIIQRFVKSSGKDDDFFSKGDRAYLRHKDGSTEQIYPAADTRAPKKDPPRSPAKAVATVALVIVLIILSRLIAARAKRSGKA